MRRRLRDVFGVVDKNQVSPGVRNRRFVRTDRAEFGLELSKVRVERFEPVAAIEFLKERVLCRVPCFLRSADPTSFPRRVRQTHFGNKPLEP